MTRPETDEALRTSAAHVFVDDLDRPELSEDDLHHLTRVLRLRAGEVVTLSDGAGRWRQGLLASGVLELSGPIMVGPTSEPQLVVGFALLKGDRSEMVTQKLTELGVDVICPFVSARCVVRMDAHNRARLEDRFRRVSREASMQSRRVRLPVVEPIRSLAEVLEATGGVRADVGGDPPSLERPAVLVGPEGGWDEVERAVSPDCVGLGAGVLRAETAAIAAGTVLGLLRSGMVRPASAL